MTSKYLAALEMSDAIENARNAQKRLREAEREVASAQHRVQTAWNEFNLLSKADTIEDAKPESRDTLTFKEFVRVRSIAPSTAERSHLVYLRAPSEAKRQGIDVHKVPEDGFMVHTWPLSLWDELWARYAPKGALSPHAGPFYPHTANIRF